MDYKKTELEHSNEFIMYQGKKINIKDCVMELIESSIVAPNLFKRMWKNVNIDTFEEIFIMDDNSIKLNSKL